MDTTKEHGRELGGHDDDDPAARILVHLVLTSQLTAACTTARLHGMSFEDIRKGFEAQLALLMTAENAIHSGISREEAVRAVEKTSSILQQNVYADADAKKDRS